MIADIKPYPAMKDSGVEWLGEVPEHWGFGAVKRHYSIQLGKMLQNRANASTDVEVPYLKAQHVQWFDVRTADAPKMWASAREVEQFGIRAGDLLVCEGGEGGRSGVIGDVGPGYIIQNALHRVRPSVGYRNDYLLYVMHTVSSMGWFAAINSKATIAHFTRDKFGSLGIPLPPLPEQGAIVRFLDYVDRRVRRHVRAKQKLIGLLEEQKQAIIHRAVTRGLDPDVPLKPSGIEWLGEVPEHWEVRRNGRLFAQRNETGFADLPIFEVSLRTGIRIRDFANSDRKQVMSDRNKYKRAVAGDIAYNMMRMWQGAVGVAPTDGLISPAYVVAKPVPGTASRYFIRLFRTAVYMTEVDKYSRGIVKDRNRLYWEDFKRMPSCYPPSHEQVMIADATDHVCRDIDAALGRIRGEIELLREYRTRLIADVVTGKLDVREAAADLPEEAEEPEPLGEADESDEARGSDLSDGSDESDRSDMSDCGRGADDAILEDAP